MKSRGFTPILRRVQGFTPVLRRVRGFTLVEVLLVIAVTAMLGGLSLAGYQGMNRRQQLRNAGLQLVASLREVRQRAISGVKQCEACQVGGECGDLDDYPLDWWGLEWGVANGLDEATYGYVGSCGEDFGNPEFPRLPENRVECGFARKVCFLNPISGRVRFEAVTGRTLAGMGVMSLCGSGRVYQVEVEDSGRIVDWGMQTGMSCGACPVVSDREGCGLPVGLPTSTPTPTLAPTSTPTPTPTGAIVEVRVAQSSDDAEERVSDGSMESLSSSDLELIRESSNQEVGMRFRSLSIAQGTTITNAYVQFTVDETDSEVTNLTINGQAIDDAPTFTSADSNISSRTKTAIAVAWNNVPAWNTVGSNGPDQRTPNLSSVIQEIVDRPDWNSGNDLVIIVTGSGRRVAESEDGSSSRAPLLHVEYGGAPPATPTPTPTPVSTPTLTPTPVSTPTPTPVSYALSFDGNNDYVLMGDPVDGSLDMGASDFTIEGWVKVSPSQDSNFNFPYKGAGSLTNPGYWFYYRNDVDDLRLTIGDGTSRVYANSNDNIGIKDGQWHHLAVTADRDGLASFYFDGQSVGTSNISSFAGHNLDTTRNFILSSSISAWGLNGTADEFRLWGDVRTQVEIQTSINQEIDPASLGLIAYWRFNEGSGQTAFDETGNGNDGVLVNNPVWVIAGW